MNSVYGEFSKTQVDEQIKLLHNAMFWLLLYKDPKTCDSFKDVDYEYYYSTLMGRIGGLNELLHRPPELITLMSLLEAAHIECQKDPFNYRMYRKYVLDAHGELDKIGEGWSDDIS